LSKTGFLSHNFGYIYARKPVKGSIDADFGLVFNKTLSQKMGQWLGAKDQVNSAQNAKTCPHCDVTSRKHQIQSENFFLDLN